MNGRIYSKRDLSKITIDYCIAMRKRRQQELYDSGPANNGKNDNLIIIGVVAVSLCSSLSTQYLYALLRQ